jgi:catalase
MVKADQIIDGGPSVLYDAVVLLVSDDGVKELIKLPAARDFVHDALAHLKFLGYQQSSKTLLAQIKDNELDGGCILLEEPGDTEKFIETCRKVRFWDRMGGVWRQ